LKYYWLLLTWQWINSSTDVPPPVPVDEIFLSI